MTQRNPNHEPVSVADLRDRLMDRALAEVVGGETPPDLSARILAGETKRTASDSRRPSIAWRSAYVAIAATLVIAGTIALSQAGLFRKSAVFRTSIARSDRVASAPNPSESTTGIVGLINDASVPNSGRNRELLELKRTLIRDRGVEAEKQQSGLAGVEVVLPSLTEEASNDRWAATLPREIALQTSEKAKVSAIGGVLADGSYLKDSRQSGYLGNRFKLESQVGAQVNRYVPTHFYADTDMGPVAGVRRKYFRSDLGTGPGTPGDQYTKINENPFIKAIGGDAVSTFSIDVDTASYANVRQFLMDMRQLPPPDAVRIEELVNYFDYDYAGSNSEDKAPFAAHVEVASCPWAPEHRLARIGIKGREIERDKQPPSNLVFLVDVSGSMDEQNKLPLVVDGLRQLTRELGENDRVAIVVYASSEGLALDSTRGDNQAAILAALGQLRAGGSTAGGAGIQLAYQIAEDHFIPAGTNRVVLCTDGDFNVGVTSTAELERLVTQKAKDTGVFLSVLGFGRGNLNDAMMQTIADRAGGNHHYVDNRREARKVLVEEMTGTLITIAKDVKIQVEFNPAQVAGYRLVGYENRMLRTEDFNDDTKDAGEIGAGHTVTALYEVIPAGSPVDVPAIDELKYQPSTKPQADTVAADASGELLTLKMRYKQPEGDTSRKLEWPVTDAGTSFSNASDDFKFASAVASFGLLLRDSQYRGEANYDTVTEIAENSRGSDPQGYRAEFVELVRRARELQASR